MIFKILWHENLVAQNQTVAHADWLHHYGDLLQVQ